MKKRTLQILIFLLFLVGALTFYLIWFNFREPEFKSIENIEVLSINNNSAEITAELKFYNPNAYSAKLLNTEIKVLSNDILVANISQSDPSEINSESDFIVKGRFKVDLLKLGMSESISGIIGQIMSEERHLKLHFVGYTRLRTSVRVYKIPVDAEREIHFR